MDGAARCGARRVGSVITYEVLLLGCGRAVVHPERVLLVLHVTFLFLSRDAEHAAPHKGDFSQYVRIQHVQNKKRTCSGYINHRAHSLPRRLISPDWLSDNWHALTVIVQLQCFLDILFNRILAQVRLLVKIMGRTISKMRGCLRHLIPGCAAAERRVDVGIEHVRAVTLAATSTREFGSRGRVGGIYQDSSQMRLLLAPRPAGVLRGSITISDRLQACLGRPTGNSARLFHAPV